MTTVANSDNDSNSVSEDKDYPNHAKIPHCDIDWALQQSPTVTRLFLESWLSDSFGNKAKNGKPQWKKLTTKLQGDNLRKTRKVLEDNEYFSYRKVTEQGQTWWEVWNKRARYSGHWVRERTDNPSPQTDNPSPQTDNPGIQTENPASSPESIATSSLENPQLSSNKILKKKQQTTNVDQERNAVVSKEKEVKSEEEEVKGVAGRRGDVVEAGNVDALAADVGEVEDVKASATHVNKAGDGDGKRGDVGEEDVVSASAEEVSQQPVVNTGLQHLLSVLDGIKAKQAKGQGRYRKCSRNEEDEKRLVGDIQKTFKSRPS